MSIAHFLKNTTHELDELRLPPFTTPEITFKQTFTTRQEGVVYL